MDAVTMIETMLEALRDADRRRLRITHWQVNYAAQDALLSDRRVFEVFYDPKKALSEQEFFGIPLEVSREPGEVPTLAVKHERYGRNLLVHDYIGDIAHGKAQDRFIAAMKSQNSDSA